MTSYNILTLSLILTTLLVGAHSISFSNAPIVFGGKIIPSKNHPAGQPISFNNQGTLPPVLTPLNSDRRRIPVPSSISFPERVPASSITDVHRRAPITFGGGAISNKPSVNNRPPNTGITFGNGGGLNAVDRIPPFSNNPIHRDVGSHTSETNEITDPTTTAFTETDTIVPHTVPLPTVDSNSRCTLEHRSVMYEGACYSLLETGPCEPNEWLVMADSGFPKCVPRICPFGLLPLLDQCVDPNDVTVCPRGQILYVDITGSVYCDCQDRFTYHAESGNCFAQHEQGICENSFYMELDEKNNWTCQPNPCGTDDQVQHEGVCYKKNYVGYCEPHLVDVGRNGNNGKADCVFIELFSIFQAPTMSACPRGSLRNFLQQCRAAFRVPTTRTMSSLGGSCKFGFNQDPTGSCRRVFSLFS